jgi:hypothetical protein
MCVHTDGGEERKNTKLEMKETIFIMDLLKIGLIDLLSQWLKVIYGVCARRCEDDPLLLLLLLLLLLKDKGSE